MMKVAGKVGRWSKIEGSWPLLGGMLFRRGLPLQRRVRDARAGYMQSLDVLMAAKECGVYTKSSIMLGLGETDEEIIDTMLDLKDAGKIRPTG